MVLLAAASVAVAAGVGIGAVAGSLLTRYYHATATKKRNRSSRSRSSYLESRAAAYRPGGQTPSQLPSPNFGTKVEIFDPSKLRSCYHLMISTLTPRPIALISSRNPQTGIDNLAPFSYFGCVAHDPPMVAISFSRKGNNTNNNLTQKDSLMNILQNNGQFVVNIISEWYLEAANHTSGNFPPNEDEFETSGLTKTNSCIVVDAPRVKEAAVVYECVLEHLVPVSNPQTGDPTTEIVLARVVRIHVDSEVLVEHYDPLKPAVDTIHKLKPIGRLGGNVYSTIGETVDIPRPQV